MIDVKAMFRRSVWTLDAWIQHANALREADQRALKIKEEGDQRALILASENQRLRDEAHNGLLNQLRDERATYATKTELEAEFNKLEAKIDAGNSNAWTRIIAITAIVATIVVGLLIGLH
jgi:hypothetical protein